MTNKEAIMILSIIRHTPSVDVFNTLPNTKALDDCIGLDYRGALDCAIQALEQNSCKTCKYYFYAFEGYPCVNCCRNFKLVDEIREQKNDLWKDGTPK